ncbi:rhomboid family intramembrane serine protease [Nocardia seriolae]|uniref:Protease n=1 Tax=Nocardia seriolae TaxID=37332 RepID=A0A0B8N8D4_9NOCA|nr:rhomboid family intramembrane serine protease [Nocardia seriolae]APA94730.1 Rhomboid protease [Nocardia seriolae]MTJ60025.1 rhomboid family intramembrane serine protease [Nocardia seriolae]MTJ70095.1 rhomboid family intramembrane serine protease [Nocardia seriolae]MTJ85027.1 rhomboid family intramembrane serine protease [Nocardia seriolae]MTK29022.1 rhomboid family intramembrane serine protease [Nocardia seriolae]
MQPQTPAPTCYRHPDRPTGLACTRCGRPACPECLTPAAVGQHCVECVQQGRNDVRPVRNAAGTRVSQIPTPYVTYSLIAINVIVFAATAFQAHSVMNNNRSRLFYDWVLVPGLVDQGGGWMRVLGSGFLHYGPIHLLANMFALYVLGPYCEVALGRGRFVAVYLAALLGGSAAVTALSDPLTASAGASGAIFGIFGAVGVIMLRTRQNLTQIAILLAVNLIITFSVPGISIWAHLGGLLAGTVATVGILYLPRWLGTRDTRMALNIGWAAIVAVALAAVLVTALGAPSLV